MAVLAERDKNRISKGPPNREPINDAQTQILTLLQKYPDIVFKAMQCYKRPEDLTARQSLVLKKELLRELGPQAEKRKVFYQVLELAQQNDEEISNIPPSLEAEKIRQKMIEKPIGTIPGEKRKKLPPLLRIVNKLRKVA